MKKCGFVAVIGETNAGKSTLINKLVGQKVSIVSRKRQTTLERIRGIAVEGDSQIIFVDTPGFLREKNVPDLEKIAWNAFRDNDIVVFVVDADKKNQEGNIALLKKIDAAKRVILVLNKTDLVYKPNLLKLIDQLKDTHDFIEIFMLSALKNDGVDKLKEYLADLMPEGEWIYTDDEATDMPFDKYAAEITREHVYDQLHQEIPYRCKVITRKYERVRHRLEIYQDVCVESESHKKIVIGHHAEKIKSIGIAARKELSRLLECRVDLFLTVVVDNPKTH